jgi:hypothetical protein
MRHSNIDFDPASLDECKNCPHLRGHHRGECALCVCPAFVDKVKRRKSPVPCEACGGSGIAKPERSEAPKRPAINIAEEIHYALNPKERP